MSYTRCMRAGAAACLRAVLAGILVTLAAHARAADGPPLRLVGGRDYPPLSYLENGVPRGYDVDVARALGGALGREVTIELLDWSAAQERVLRGEADGLTNLAISADRRDRFEFADSIITQNFGLFVRVGDTSFGGVADLAGRRVGVTEWGFPRQYLTQQAGVQLIVIDDLRDGFDRLSAGALDAVAADVWVGTYIIEKSRTSGIALAGAPFASVPAAIAIRQGNHALVESINQAIRKLAADGTLQAIQERWRPREMVFLSRERVESLVGYGVAALLLLLAAAATIWALTLGRQIQRRRESEAALQESSQRLGLALQAADMGTWRWDAATNRDTRDAVLNRILGLDSVQSTNELDDAFAHMHPDDRDRVRGAFDRAIREHGTYAVEFRVVHPDGEIHWVRSRGRPYYDEHGTLERFTGTVLDITDQREVEERLQLLAHAFSSASDCISIADPDGTILSVNESFLRTYEYDEAEIVGKDLSVIRLPQVPVDWESASGGWRGEVERRTKSGKVLRMDVALSVVRDPTGAVVATVGVARDITNETLAQEALRASEEKFFKVFQASPDSIVITDHASGVIIDVNEAFERITGYGRGEMLGKTILGTGVVTDPDYRARVLSRLSAAGGALRDYELTIRRKNGETATMILSSETLEIAGRPCILTIARDISEQKRFELHLRQAAEINKLLLSELDPNELHIAIIEAAYQILALDYAGLILVDPETKALTLRAQRGVLDAGRSSQSGAAIAREAYESEEIHVFRRADLEAIGQPVAELLEAGIQTICSLPLATPHGTLGCLSVGSRKAAPFSVDDLTLLQQLSTHVAIAIQNARAYEEIRVLKDELSEEKLYLEEEIRVSHNFADIVGESAAVRRVLQQIETVAPTDASVLLLGETGTGKELLARALHELSPRKERTFVKVNAAALPATLLESELFGYERGAFTGAVAGKVGRMELAHRGTLFLDEIGDIPLEVQPKLLRALQEREFERLGSTRTQKVDVRVIAATNRNLERMVDEGTFRSDLFYRLNVFPIQVPPLRERREDVPLLVRYFVQKFASKLRRQITTIPSATMTALQEWDWPGNIRELENVIERAVIVSNGDVLQVPAFSLKTVTVSAAATETLSEKEHAIVPASSSFEDGERHIILRALRDAKGVIAGPSGAAARLGVKRTTLQSKMRKLGIRRPAF